MSRKSRFATMLFSLLVLSLLVGCATTMKQPIYSVPDFQSAAITEVIVLPPLDLRADKNIEVDLHKQLQKAAADILKEKGFRVTTSTDLGDVGELLEDDLKAAEPNWIKRLGPAGARYVMVLCLMDVATKLTFGSTGNAELAGYLYDKQAAILMWRDKGIGQTGQGGLIGMVMKSWMDEEAISMALKNLMDSIPKRAR